MSNVNENKKNDVKLIKHFIKDLSFENPQTINEHNVKNNSDHDIDVNMNILHKSYENNHFSLVLKHILDCTSNKTSKKLFYLELDYFGFFRIINKEKNDQKILTENALSLLFPFSKEIIMNITRWGGSVQVSLNNIDFSLIKKINY